MWFLYVATPLVPRGGDKLPAYRRLIQVVRGMPQPFLIDTLEINLVSANSPIAKAIADMHQRYPEASRPIYYRGAKFGELYVEGGYVYPPIPAPVPTGKDQQ